MPASPKIILGAESPDNYVLSLKNFLDFVKNDSKLATKEQYYTLMNECASLLPEYCKKELPMLRPEIAENADKIFKWKCILEMEEKGANKGEIIYHKFFDKNLKEKALNEYVAFVEKMTGKKVL